LFLRSFYDYQLKKIIKNKIIPIDKARKIKIEDLKALRNIKNISKKKRMD
jgi:hypothetical protein